MLDIRERELLRKRREYRRWGSDFRRKFKKKLYDKQNGKCPYCEEIMLLFFGEEQTKNQHLPLVATFEHITPLEWGGRTSKTNMVLACRRCNSDRGEQFVMEKFFLYYILEG